MRHWTPWIKDAVAEMRDAGVKQAVAIVMAPHYSSLSIGRYQQRVAAAQQELNSGIQFRFVTSWWEQPRFLQALEENIADALKKFPADSKARRRVIFTAHSLPARILESGDPYDEQLKTNARVVTERMGLKDCMFAYQSAGATPEPWLGPALEDVLPDLAAEGYRQVLVVPIGFVCDHVEILYDIDIEARKIAEENGIHLERTESMNTKRPFIQAVADAILQEAGEPRVVDP
jgi:ferrochelatase